MAADSEDEVKKALGIESWRNLSKDGVMRLAAMMPQVSREVALKIAEHFPDFKTLAVETLDAVGKQLDATLKRTWKSQKKVHKAYEVARAAYIKELDRDLTADQRRDLYDRILDTANREAEKDTEHKSFAMTALKTTGAVVGVVLVAALAFVGGRIGGGKGSA